MEQGTRGRWYRGADRILGGVCSGLGAGLHVDPLWVRIAFVLLALVQGLGVFLYVVLWIVMPEHAGAEPSARSRFGSMMGDIRRVWHDLRSQFGGARHAGPSAPAEGFASPANQVNSTRRNPSAALGLVLVVVGILFLADNLGLVTWNVIWPVALIVIGVLFLARGATKRS